MAIKPNTSVLSSIKRHTAAEVFFQDQFVGAVAYSPGDAYSSGEKIATFEYDAVWRDSGIELSPITMPLSEKKYQFPSLPEATFKGLPGMLADCLPDDFGNAVINAWLARENRPSNSFSAIERLLYTGQRGMGALEFKPTLGTRIRTPKSIHLDALIEMAQQVLDNRQTIKGDLQSDKDEALKEILLVGTSAGGARPKAVVAIDKQQTKILSGQVTVPEGFTHYLLKFDGVVTRNQGQETFGDPAGFGRMEYAYYLMAKDAGINMMPSFILEDGNLAHFVTERFDRIGNQKRHIQSLCGFVHADYKQPGLYSYEELFQLMRRLKLRRSDALQMFRRMAFNVIARNHDDHTKNFAFILNPTQQSKNLIEQQLTWNLAPAFDVAFSYKPGSPWVNSHQMTINGKRDDFTKDDLIGVVPNSLRNDVSDILEEVIDVVSDWPKYSKQAGVFSELDTFIKQSHRTNIK
ncbi:MAG: type II toxin-antitoxin system HipA family toxin [Gammaproteobacteria bacterium]|nr:type II toxin-antitoxin system HipA family toxin [Gammaproteobacteria bacterium]